MKPTGKTEILIAAGLGLLMLGAFFSILGDARPWVIGLDEVNLLMHESGHVFFGSGGELVSALGGTAMQLIIPAAICGYFVYKKDKTGLSFGIFWLGQNLVNIGVYVKDARTKLLPLVNGGTHDWDIILSKLNLLKLDSFLGNLVQTIGYLAMLAAIIMIGLWIFEKLKQITGKPLI
jgi:hypothetical protein